MYNLGYNKSFENSVTSDTYKVMIVRHPLDRIVSAYKYIFQELAGMGFETFCLQNESQVFNFQLKMRPNQIYIQTSQG